MASNSSPGSPAGDPNHQRHTTHTFDVPYRSSFKPKTSPDDTSEEPPKVTPIPKISPPTSPSQPAQSSLAEGLEGKYVDEFGNILDWDGTVLGSVEGDLPSMVGRPVSNNGEILDVDGEVVGHVSENHARPPLKELDGGLRVDSAGNIYNQDGAVIGKLNEPPKKNESSPDQSGQADGSQNKQSPRSAPKPHAAPNPSEIYLDVKSTFDGIQLIIKIPTVFNREEGGHEHK